MRQYVLLPTLKEIKARLGKRYPGISLAAVYNTAHALETADLLQAIRFDCAAKVLYDANLSAHFYFMDEFSGRLYAIDPNQVEPSFNPPEEITVESVSILIR